MSTDELIPNALSFSFSFWIQKKVTYLAGVLAPPLGTSSGFQSCSLVHELISMLTFSWWWLYMEWHVCWGESNFSWRWVFLLRWLHSYLASVRWPMVCYWWIFLLFCCDKNVDISAPLVCFFIYFGIFASVMMEAMPSACISYPFVIECCGVSVPITWGLVSVN